MFNKKDITIIYDPVYSIVIRNVFPKEVNKKILDEAIANKKKYEIAKVGGLTNDKVKKTTRNNLSAFYDIIYSNKSLEQLVNKAKIHPEDIVANRVHKMKIVNNFPDSMCLNNKQLPVNEHKQLIN